MICNVPTKIPSQGIEDKLSIRDENEVQNFLESIEIVVDNASPYTFWKKMAEKYYHQSEYQKSLICWIIAASKSPHTKEPWVKISALQALFKNDNLAVHLFCLADSLPFPE
jgi:hypothetical protein